MTGADTKARDVAPVKPSSRDPIAQWLDVFTSLLALPAGESDRIRDELEDHLRTRVDDLLILGMSEPEAVQKAVTELGETAQLARNFKAVRTHSRRRIAMHTALFAAAGLALTVSVAGFLPRANTAPVTSPSAIVDAQPEDQNHRGMLDRDLPAGKLGDMLQMLADAGNARLFVHWASLEPMGLDADTEIRAIPAKGLEHGKVRQLINSALGLDGGDQLTARMDGTLVEIATQAYFDRIEMVQKEYDLTELTKPYNFGIQSRDILTPIYETVEPEIWSNKIGSLSMSGMFLNVRAPARVQAEVQKYLARLLDRHAATIAQMQSDQEKLELEQIVKREREIADLKDKLELANTTLDSHDELMRQLAHDYWSTKMDIVEFELVFKNSPDERERHETKNMLVNAQVRMEYTAIERERLQSQISNTLSQIYTLEQRLISLQDSQDHLGGRNTKDAAAVEFDSAARNESAGR